MRQGLSTPLKSSLGAPAEAREQKLSGVARLVGLLLSQSRVLIVLVNCQSERRCSSFSLAFLTLNRSVAGPRREWGANLQASAEACLALHCPPARFDRV